MIPFRPVCLSIWHACLLLSVRQVKQRSFPSLILLSMRFLWIHAFQLILLSILGSVFTNTNVQAQVKPLTKIYPVAKAWSKNSINAIIFRKNSLVTYKKHQYIAFYDEEGQVVLGKRRLGSENWSLITTSYSGNVKDAHNVISIMVDGTGYLHVSWDHHNNPLNYCRSTKPESLKLGPKMAMTGSQESRVAYPEFYKLANGNLLFTYRNGESGKGNLIVNLYDCKQQKWTTLHDNLINGEGQRNAYIQTTVDKEGVIHLSWVWRSSADVSTNHNMCYARSRDGGHTWEKSNSERYTLPITAGNAEVAARIPPNSELINQTSMTTDDIGNPVIATYWKESAQDVPQYHLIYLQNDSWNVKILPFRKTNFTLSGVGTKRIPVSRPQILASRYGGRSVFYMIFRDEERKGKVSLLKVTNDQNNHWGIIDLFNEDMGAWEPTLDTELWKKKKIVNLYLQKVEQADLEGQTDFPPQMVNVLEWKP